ncbi:hypothetical protein [Streptomyces sp. KE1]|nr:hypothetical protein [Streptomyces sp. KE1]
MPTLPLVGAGPGLGLSLAKVFGGHGYEVALISRSKDKLDALVAELAGTGVTAEGFAAESPTRSRSPARCGARRPGSGGSTSWSSRRTRT